MRGSLLSGLCAVALFFSLSPRTYAEEIEVNAPKLSEQELNLIEPSLLKYKECLIENIGTLALSYLSEFTGTVEYEMKEACSGQYSGIISASTVWGIDGKRIAEYFYSLYRPSLIARFDALNGSFIYSACLSREEEKLTTANDIETRIIAALGHCNNDEIEYSSGLDGIGLSVEDIRAQISDKKERFRQAVYARLASPKP